MYWETLLAEVQNKNDAKAYSFSASVLSKTMNQKNQPRRNAVCKLGNKYPNIGFSTRETECMLKILRGKTMAKTAQELGLSTRTVEFYCSNMRKKLNCKKKSQLINIILNSDFLQNAKIFLNDLDTCL